jgi:hypothetical protein
LNVNEVWKDISEFINVYQVSNLGKIRRIGDYSNQFTTWKLSTPKIISQTNSTNGYMCVKLSYNNKTYTRYVHRLVANAFCNNLNPNKYTEVNHIDGNKTNNKSENLEWCDRSYNNKHAYVKGLHTLHGCYGQKKTVVQIDINTNKIIKIHESVESAAKQVGLKNSTNISACCNYAENPNKYKKPCLSSKGYKWRFATDEMKAGDIID